MLNDLRMNENIKIQALENMINYKSQLEELKLFLERKKIDYFILPNSDEFFCEYLPESEKRIASITGFTGSNATLILGKKNKFFTDSRYLIQAKNEIDVEQFEIIDLAQISVLLWLKKNVKKDEVVAIDPKLVNIEFVQNCRQIVKNVGGNIVILDDENTHVILGAKRVEDLAQQERFLTTTSSKMTTAINFHPLEFSGVDSLTKRQLITENLDADMLLISESMALCWLLNIRSSDVEFTPLLRAYALLFKDGKVELFINEKRLTSEARDNLSNVVFTAKENLSNRIAELTQKYQTIQLDERLTNYWVYDLFVKNGFAVKTKTDPCQILKACKNSTEIAGARKAHLLDAIAINKFLNWLDFAQKNGEEIDEIQAEEKLLELRQEAPEFIYPSFASISAFAENGAIVHYRASVKTNKKIQGNSLYLIDSGSQYLCGTTDVTRTIAIGKPTMEMIRNFTLVLKGHIALAQAKFPLGTTGAQLDILARKALWREGKNYGHGTGHGIGSFLSVHEGPCSISPRSQQPLMAGMILSNEPGYYVEGQYGIRIENLVLVVKSKEEGFLEFETLTLVPIDQRLIDFTLLDEEEKLWLKNYEERVKNSPLRSEVVAAVRQTG